MVTREIVLRVTTEDDEQFVKVAEVLSRTMSGLALDGFQVATAATTLCEGCEDCDPDFYDDPEAGGEEDTDTHL